MANITYVPLPNELLSRLVQRYEARYDDVIEYVVKDFLDKTAEEFDAPHRTNDNGYMWGQVYLPDGTKFRASYKNELNIAEVSNGNIVFNGEAYPSPSKLCVAMRGNTVSNAWTTLEIRRPEDSQFYMADYVRTQAYS